MYNLHCLEFNFYKKNKFVLTKMSRSKGSPNNKPSIIDEYIKDSHWYRVVSADECSCIVCGVKLTIDRKQGIKNLIRHEKSQQHASVLSCLYKLKTKDTCADSEDIHNNIVSSFISAGISLNSLDNVKIRDMFEECFGFKLRTAQTYRTYTLPNIIKKQRELLLKHFYDKDFILFFDETTDINGRYILNIMAKVLDGTKQETYLINSICLDKTNTAQILSKLEFTLGSIIQCITLQHRFKYLVTDGAAYCLKVGKKLKELYPQLKHIVCLCHNLHLVAEEIRKSSILANKLISNLKKATCKNKTNQMIYRESTGLPLPKYPVVTRWGTFIDCACFVNINFEKIKNFVNELDSDYSKLKAIICDENTKNALDFVAKHQFITDALKYLESSNLNIKSQILKIREVKEQINNIEIFNRFTAILNKNPDFKELETVVLCDSLPETYNFLDITTVDVERSFNHLKTLLSDTRRNIKDENLYYYLSLKINKFFQ